MTTSPLLQSSDSFSGQRPMAEVAAEDAIKASYAPALAYPFKTVSDLAEGRVLDYQEDLKSSKLAPTITSLSERREAVECKLNNISPPLNKDEIETTLLKLLNVSRPAAKTKNINKDIDVDIDNDKSNILFPTKIEEAFTSPEGSPKANLSLRTPRKRVVSVSQLNLGLGLSPSPSSSSSSSSDSYSRQSRKKRYSETRPYTMSKAPKAVPLNNQKCAVASRHKSPVHLIKNDLSEGGEKSGVNPYIVRYTTGQSVYMYPLGVETSANSCVTCQNCAKAKPVQNFIPIQLTNSQHVFGSNIPASCQHEFPAVPVHVPIQHLPVYHHQQQRLHPHHPQQPCTCQQQQQQQQQALKTPAAPLKYCFKITTVLPSNSNSTPSPHIYLDLTGRTDIKTSIAFSEHAKSDSETLRSEDVQKPKSRLQKEAPDVSGLNAEMGKSYVGIKPPICVPRAKDHLGTWRTCMVPPWDLEQFAFSSPPTRRWNAVSNPTPGNVLLFTLMCYNILSDQYATRQSYWHCPSWALSWGYRRRGILEDIISRSPCIVCLQEVETEQYYSFFLPQLAQEGYDGIFSAKSRANTMTETKKKRVDGCAILWKRNKFRIVAEHVIDFSRTYLNTYWNSEERKSSPSSEELLNRVMTRDNIALAAVLEPKSGGPGSGFMVSTAHIHWDPEFCDVKLIQTITLTSALREKMQEYQQIYEMDQSKTIPLILCGDFNSLPQSGVIQFLNSGRIDRQHPEFKTLGTDPSLEKLSSSLLSDELSHSFDLTSCYDNDLVHMKYTNFTKDFKGKIDYIFVNRPHLKMLGCLDGIPTSWYTKEKVIGCPHPYVSSDHIPLLVELELRLT